MTHRFLYILLLNALLFSPDLSWGQSTHKVEEYLTYPSPTSVTSGNGSLVWVFNEQGRRNIYKALAPEYKAEKLTDYTDDDGQEITNVSVSDNGKWVVYVRGGEHGSNWSATATVNPESKIKAPKVEVWCVSIHGGKPIFLGNGSYPRISPNSDEVVFMRSGTPYIVPINGSKKAKTLFSTKGTVRHAKWSPSGDKLAFSVSRTTHAFIGVYAKDKENIEWISPSFDKDMYPVWSPDEQKLAFVRIPGSTKEPDSLLTRKHLPWEIHVADIQSKKSKAIYTAPKTLEGSRPTTSGRYNLNWTDNGVTYLSYEDGWPHLYTMQPDGSHTIQLTKGDFMVEDIQVSSTNEKIIFSANTGDLSDDIDRRHVGIVSTNKADMKLLTNGKGIESSPVFLDSETIAFLSSTYNRPAIPAWLPLNSDNEIKLIGEDKIPTSLRNKNFVEPEQVIYQSEDGVTVHGQLFEKKDGRKNKPAVVFVHGGPQRQILLAWDHRSYYSHSYAMNQYLADQGFVVLSVNYRLGIGYGYHFHKPEGSHRFGASEYKDILAAGKWLQEQPQVDKNKIGIYGGSYGGFLTALALSKNSDIFAAGVDIHGVHSRVPSKPYNFSFEKAPDAQLADSIVWKSSPIAYVDNWKSPVLLIHADDDRNVGFTHSVDLYQRLKKRNVEVETLIIPDDTHHWMLHKNLQRISTATVKFLYSKLTENSD